VRGADNRGSRCFCARRSARRTAKSTATGALALTPWGWLDLDRFWGERLAPSRKGTRWDRVLFVLAAYRLIAPGSEWRLHREWYGRTALADLLGADASLAEPHLLYGCHDKLLAHKAGFGTASGSPRSSRACARTRRVRVCVGNESRLAHRARRASWPRLASPPAQLLAASRALHRPKIRHILAHASMHA
jgi:hypothetical protein